MNAPQIRSASCLRERVVGSATVVELRGEIDIQTAPLVSARLDALTAGPSPELVLDLRSVTFIDCSGLAALCRARTRVLSRCGRLRLVSGSPRLMRILRLTNLAHAFDVHSRLPDDLLRTPVAGGVLSAAAS